jgi:hypothetical protein
VRVFPVEDAYEVIADSVGRLVHRFRIQCIESAQCQLVLEPLSCAAAVVRDDPLPTLRVTPAMEARIANHLWSIAEIIGLLD